MAAGLLAQAREIFQETQNALERRAWSLVVRRSQEAVELALKAALRQVGLEVPHVHDVGSFLKDNEQRFPEGFRSKIGRLASGSRRLRSQRERSFYGDEATGRPPHKLYTEDDARKAPDDAAYTVEGCGRLIEGLVD